MKIVSLMSAVALAFGAFAADEACPVSENIRGHENIEWMISYAYHLTDAQKDLPRVLLVGDSICNDYQDGVQRALDGRVNVTFWVSSYCLTMPAYRKLLDVYLAEAKYDVIHLNNGLHSLQTETSAWAKSFRETLLFIREKQPHAKIIWCTSTPLKDPKLTAKAKELNASAAEVLKEFGDVATNDLFALADPLVREIYWRDVYHHTNALREKEVKKVADAVLSELNREK